MQPSLAAAKQTVVANLVSRRAAFEEALRQQEAAAAANESAMGKTQRALTDYGAASMECETFDRRASTAVGIVDILATVVTIPTGPIPKYVVRSIGNGAGNGVNQFNTPWGIAAHPSGVLIVADLLNKPSSDGQTGWNFCKVDW